MSGSPVTAHVRKVHKVGRSKAVIIPPDVLEHIHCTVEDYIYFDTTAPDFCVISRAPVPPTLTHPELFEQPAPPPPTETPPETTVPTQDQTV